MSIEANSSGSIENRISSWAAPLNRELSRGRGRERKGSLRGLRALEREIENERGVAGKEGERGLRWRWRWRGRERERGGERERYTSENPSTNKAIRKVYLT